MNPENEIIEIDIDEELYEKIKIVALEEGFTPEDYIKFITEEYVKSQEYIIREGEMAELFANGEPEAEPV